MARAPIEGPEQLFHFAEAAVPATTLPAFEPVRVVAEPVESVLITGIAGGQGRLIARRIGGGRCRIIGVDRTPWEGHPSDVRMHVLDIRKRKFEDVFRTERPDAVVHHAFVRHFRGDPLPQNRFPTHISNSGACSQYRARRRYHRRKWRHWRL